ncbi:endolytic transglycosylase MltG [Anaerobacillus sp. CMMVII]|uniref:endolytic transglycosylase MltG n=1 Tax=Anaerobacillus sp. CMMVII TaxID=2755588 RepID=UPI0021B6EFFD|nr:endolytic transglycosylase MltG [Anaerobacillus sp. CMMVII]MCT8139724.1 endolytic transglycosylase MltG [Anaerobacillus sp. CMMVII]
MTKKMLQGIATGILLTTLLFTYKYYFTDDFHVITEVTSNEKVVFTEQDLEEYLQVHGLAVIDQLELEQLQNNQAVLTETPETTPPPEKVIEKEVIKEITFTIEPGTSSGSVGQLLEEKGLISDRKLFDNYLIKNKLEGKIKAGEYFLTSEMTLEEIIEKLT